MPQDKRHGKTVHTFRERQNDNTARIHQLQAQFKGVAVIAIAALLLSLIVTLFVVMV